MTYQEFQIIMDALNPEGDGVAINLTYSNGEASYHCVYSILHGNVGLRLERNGQPSGVLFKDIVTVCVSSP